MSVRAGLETGCTEEESRSMRKQALRTLLGDVLTATIVQVKPKLASAMPVCTLQGTQIQNAVFSCHSMRCDCALLCCDHTVRTHRHQLMSLSRLDLLWRKLSHDSASYIMRYDSTQEPCTRPGSKAYSRFWHRCLQRLHACLQQAMAASFICFFDTCLFP